MQKNKIILNSKQQEIFDLCKNFVLSIKPPTLKNKIQNFFVNRTALKGIYMHGGVGVGKTMLMRKIYDLVSLDKEIIHFQKFMQDLHIKFHKLQSESSNKIIQNLASDMAKRSWFICIDEFEIKDITDAMIIMNLFKYILRYDVFIFLTTNIEPDNLYSDGIARESFLPFIDIIKENFSVIHLDTEKDYRYDTVSNIKKRIFYPYNLKNRKEIEMIKRQLCDHSELSSKYVENFGRKIHFKNTHQNILFTNFTELFERDLSYTDYVTICTNFDLILLESVRLIDSDELNIITRFINFIDNAYFYKKLLFIELVDAPEKIYKKGERIKEFSRTISRLFEMNSDKYFDNRVN